MSRAFSPAIALFAIAILALLLVTHAWRWSSAPTPLSGNRPVNENTNSNGNANTSESESVPVEIVRADPHIDPRVLAHLAASQPVLVISAESTFAAKLDPLRTLEVDAGGPESRPVRRPEGKTGPLSLSTDSLRNQNGIPTTHPAAGSAPSAGESGVAATSESGLSFQLIMQGAVSLLLLAAALWMLIGIGKPENTKWATATIGTVVGFWLHTS